MLIKNKASRLCEKFSQPVPSIEPFSSDVKGNFYGKSKIFQKVVKNYPKKDIADYKDRLPTICYFD